MGESLTALRTGGRPARQIRALGSVNVSAIEEYKRVKARYDALMHQVTDVEESRNELTRMIASFRHRCGRSSPASAPSTKTLAAYLPSCSAAANQPCAGG
ncbi:MAG: hypothetical protein ACLTNY_00160 [Blautia massiliensis (ex Durand et al. 2017)]